MRIARSLGSLMPAAALAGALGGCWRGLPQRDSCVTSQAPRGLPASRPQAAGVSVICEAGRARVLQSQTNATRHDGTGVARWESTLNRSRESLPDASTR